MPLRRPSSRGIGGQVECPEKLDHLHLRWARLDVDHGAATGHRRGFRPLSAIAEAQPVPRTPVEHQHPLDGRDKVSTPADRNCDMIGSGAQRARGVRA